MAIKTNHPQIILYWMELIIGIICIALAGRGYNEIGFQYLIAIGATSAIGNIVFLLLYGFATTRPIDGRSIMKLIETVYQFILTLLYCIAIGVTFHQLEYLQRFIGPITIFTSANFGVYTFGSMVALTELICKHEEETINQQNPITNPTQPNIQISLHDNKYYRYSSVYNKKQTEYINRLENYVGVCFEISITALIFRLEMYLVIFLNYGTIAYMMSYPPDASRSCHEADGRSDRSGGSGGATSGSGGGVYGTLCSAIGGGGKWSTTSGFYDVGPDPLFSLAPSTTNEKIISNWKKWSLGLDYLLQDSEGVSLFKSYLQYEGCANLLDFWFACQGFRSKVDPSDHRKITQLIKAIYRTYIRGASSSLNSQPLMYLGKQQSTGPLLQNRSEPIRLRSETRHAITERISRKHALDQTVFDSAQAEVEHFLRTTAYPAFLKSDVYVDFLQTALEGSTHKFPSWEQSAPTSVFSFNVDKQLNIATTTGLSECPPNVTLGGKVLPTLDEDRELQSEELSLSDPLRRIHRPCCHIVSSSDTAAVTPHCQHCNKCHLYNPCLPMECSQSVLKPPWCYQQSPSVSTGSTPAPLTMENLQMTRFYRTEMSLQRPYLNQSHISHITRPSQEGELTSHPHVSRLCSSTPWRFPTRPNYVYTHWADAVCPPSMDPRLGNLPSQPPNPYHISYAPVSARDSEHHSLSSDARTDDTHSHTDSSHEGACNRLHSLNHRIQVHFNYLVIIVNIKVNYHIVINISII
ncbi:unnamed protein product [Heterobilharzia americana]|nr:unnamed protein product [Heterobilharzia americana]